MSKPLTELHKLPLSNIATIAALVEPLPAYAFSK